MVIIGLGRPRRVCSAVAYIAAAWGSQSQCAEDLEHVADMESSHFWKYAYAWGNSLPLDAGKYDACRRGVKGIYFLVNINENINESEHAVVGFNGAEEAKELEFWGGVLSIGVCAPTSCNESNASSDVEDFMKTRNATKLVPGLRLVKVVSARAVSPKELKSGLRGFFVIFLCGAPFCAVLVASLQRMMRDSADNGEGDAPSEGLFITTFAMNGSKGSIAKMVEPIPPRPTDCFNGIRVLSLAWIVFAHTVYYTFETTRFADPMTEKKISKRPWFMLIVSAEFAVDTMFFLSAFLFAQLIYKQLEQSDGRLPIMMAILQRYLRLTPSLAFTLLPYAFVWPYILEGPFARSLQQKVTDRCYISWWSALTYTMNFFPWHYSGTCMTWTWYLGNDMCFFIAGLPIALLHYRNEQLGTLLLCFLALASTALTIGLIMHGDGLSVRVTDGNKYTGYIDQVYGKPYCRIPAYLIGMATSWTVRSLERRGMVHGRGVRTPGERLAVSLVLLVTFLVVMALIFVPGVNYRKAWSKEITALFVSLSRPCWAICCAILTLCCYYDITPVARQLLSSGIFVPCVRISYGIYLAHPVIIQWFAGTRTQFMQIGLINFLLQFIMLWVVSCIAAIFLWVVVESPSMMLTGMLKSGAGRAGPPQPRRSGPATLDRGSVRSRASSGFRIQALPSNMSGHTFAVDIEQDLVSNLSCHSFVGDSELPPDHASNGYSASRRPTRSFGVGSKGSVQIELGNTVNK